MTFRGVAYTVTESADPGFWNWQFTIAGTTLSGRTRTALRAMAVRRVEVQVTAALKKFGDKADQPKE